MALKAQYLSLNANYCSAAPLAVFRFFFGSMMLFSIVRFWLNGWIETLYTEPRYLFPYYGFEFVKAPGQTIYFLFLACGISSLLVALGLFYRLAIITLFLSFTYIELLDKTTYLNHYYFISLISFLMIFLPAGSFFSLDVLRKPSLYFNRIHCWCSGVIKLMVGILYFYAGLAKINSDWLLHALPLKIWLPARNDMPLIGFLFNYSWVHFLFSWFGCLYDLSIPFLLLYRKTRLFAYATVIVFHMLTAMLFPIGVFPYVMIVTALIFFSDEFHQRLVNSLRNFFRTETEKKPDRKLVYSPVTHKLLVSLFGVFFFIQLILPFRYLLYPGELFWTEEGYRFSWRVMLMEKAGYSEFTVKDSLGNYQIVNNDLFLTDLQEKMMATQPDMTLQYAHYLAEYYEKKGFKAPEVYVNSYVTLNGRMGRTFIDPERNLAKEKESFKHKDWILPFNENILGF